MPTDTDSMVLIPAGEFLMGAGDEGVESGASEEERPRHAVYLDDFLIDVSLVTNAAYARFVSETGHREPAAWHEDDRPVVGLGWADAQAYCAWAGKRLPTEAEWEKAARGDLEGALYPWGNDPFDGSQAPDGNRDDPPPVVRSYPPNAFGLYDMVGSVWQWCHDDRRVYDARPQRNPVGPLSDQTRATRGGDWFSRAYHKRCSRRGGASVNAPSRSLNIGFRCVRNAE